MEDFQNNSYKINRTCSLCASSFPCKETWSLFLCMISIWMMKTKPFKFWRLARIWKKIFLVSNHLTTMDSDMKFLQRCLAIYFQALNASLIFLWMALVLTVANHWSYSRLFMEAQLINRCKLYVSPNLPGQIKSIVMNLQIS